MDAADFKTLLFSFRGRINRAKWWLALVVFIVYGVVASGVAGITLSRVFMSASDFGVGTMVVLGAAVIAYLVALYAGIAVGVKRLHDRNKSGWWILLLYVAPGILGTVGERLGETPVGLLLALITLVLYVWMFVELACLRGTVGPNKYGPDPLESDETQPAATV
jgi:uncharacterized membrane protein YhaH (DUF805 family)